ncbi:GNAT family N-acetyltransferase [Paenibacillus sp. FA6]|uniref:GNAT family N-acetyltransferase n=1 Tax=Paenibacillus sp. FA6 TaxID=3413029 RepID=UPI003F6596F5
METPLMNEYVNERVRAYQANVDDEQDIMDILLNIARWLHSKGSTQWAGLLEGEDSHDMIGSISRGEVFIFKENGLCVGTVILKKRASQWDEELWGENDEQLDSAVYLHRLAVNRGYAGKGLGEEILRWVESDIHFKGKDRIRLDCIANNDILNSYYPRYGYSFMGEVKGFSKYEKLLPMVQNPYS